MNTLLNEESKVLSSGDSDNVISDTSLLKSVSFRKFRGSFSSSLEIEKNGINTSWECILRKLRSKPANANSQIKVNQPEAKSTDRRKFPRHASEAIVLAFNHAESDISDERNHPGGKGYAINISQNGISFASRCQFNLREELRLHIEEQFVNCALDLVASVVRVSSIDDQFWRIDCKLATALTEHQVLLLKEHVPSCYAG